MVISRTAALQKALLPMVLTELPNVIVANLVQYANAFSEMVSTASGTTMDFKTLQPQKAPFPIVFRLSGSVTDCNDNWLWKAPSSRVVSPVKYCSSSNDDRFPCISPSFGRSSVCHDFFLLKSRQNMSPKEVTAAASCFDK